MAIFLQILSARLGVVTGKDLAQACRDWYPQLDALAATGSLCELAIGACDLAEVLGSAVAINLLFHIPLFWAVLITAPTCCCCWRCSAFGMRTIEAIVLVLVATIGTATSSKSLCCRRRSPDFARDGPRRLLAPGLPPARDDYLAIGIIGATVMPHNLYLHSALVQSRKLQEDRRLDPQRHSVQHDRLDARAVDRVPRQRGDPGAGGDRLLR